MLALLSPAKTLALDAPLPTRKHTQPRNLDESAELIEVMRAHSPEEVADLMGISPELAALNVERYKDFELPLTTRNARPAALMFAGDVYQGLRAGERFDARDWTQAQKSLRILSGLYGLLRPLDLIAPYRLEMGTGVHTDRGANLYEYWGTTIRDLLVADLADSPGADVVVNLASVEYATAARLDEVDARVISPRFEDQNPKGEWKVMSFPAKKARGEMAGWLVAERIRTAKALSGFDAAGYRYQPEFSTPEVPVFRRKRP